MESVKLCVRQHYVGSDQTDSGKLYFYPIKNKWSETDITWASLQYMKVPLNPDSNIINLASGMKCFDINLERFMENTPKFGVILIGDERASESERVFCSSEFETSSITSPASHPDYHPHWRILSVSGSKSKGSSGGTIAGIVVSLAVLISCVAFFLWRRRRNYRGFSDEDSEETEEPKKDLIDVVGEVFGISSSLSESDSESEVKTVSFDTEFSSVGGDHGYSVVDSIYGRDSR